MNWLKFIPGVILNAKLKNLDYDFVKLLFSFKNITITDDHIKVVKEYVRLALIDNDDATVSDMLKDEALINLFTQIGVSAVKTHVENKQSVERIIADEMNRIEGCCPTCDSVYTLANFANNLALRSKDESTK